ncbi:MAG TPA: hypothetical protein VK508_15165 [Cyclobacteriaceae bacterium]|nr:hypothetical protein [Cyclobacteriaceae bacterium]
MTRQATYIFILLAALALLSGWTTCRAESTRDNRKSTIKAPEFRSVPAAVPCNNGPSHDLIVTSDEATHAPAVQVSGAALAVIISFLNTSNRQTPLPDNGRCIQTSFHRILFRSIISPNAP